ncbi:MAG: hypothetical protein K6B44_09760 [Lachnospiraceae bacterium]|nr:hypothetical protein [Lachnospiraceae bacterium]
MPAEPRKFGEIEPEELRRALGRAVNMKESFEEKAEFLLDLYNVNYGSIDMSHDHPKQHEAIDDFLTGILDLKDENGKLDGKAVKDFIHQMNAYRLQKIAEYSEMIISTNGGLNSEIHLRLDAMPNLLLGATLAADNNPLFIEWNREHPDDKLNNYTLDEMIVNDFASQRDALPPERQALINGFVELRDQAYASQGIVTAKQKGEYEKSVMENNIDTYRVNLEWEMEDLIADPAQRLIMLAEAGDIHTLVREYVDMAVKVGLEGDEDLRDSLEDFEEYLQEPVEGTSGIHMQPKRGAVFIATFLEEMAMYRGELLVKAGIEGEKFADQIRRGEIPGTELYAGNEAAIKEISDAMMNGTELYAKVATTANAMKLASMPFDTTVISGDMADKYGYETMPVQYFIGKPLEDAVNAAVKADYPDGMHYKAKGERLVPDQVISSKYGLAISGSGYAAVTDEDGKNMAVEKAAESNAKAQKACSEYAEAVEDITDRTYTDFRKLYDIARSKRTNSKQFTDMLWALQDVSELDRDKSPEEIEKALTTLKESAGKYKERIDGSIFRGVTAAGKERRQLADDLEKYASEQLEKLAKCKGDRLNERMPLSEQLDGLEKNRQLIASARELEARRVSETRKPAAEADTITKPVSRAQVIEHPAADAETILSKPVSKAQTIVRPRSESNPVNLGKLMDEQRKADGKAEAKNDVREEVLRKREAIMQKRRENEAAGIVSDGKNQAQQQAGKGGKT